jgi:hypothetical protein
MGNKCYIKNNQRKVKEVAQNIDKKNKPQTNTQTNIEGNTQNIVETNIQNNAENNIQNIVETNIQNNAENNIQNIVETNTQNNIETDTQYEPQEILELIINSLIDDKKKLLQKLEKNNINTQKYRDNNNNIINYGNLKYPEEYKLKIDELLKEVNELEGIIKKNKMGNQNNVYLKTRLSFKFAPGGECTLNVENETRLGDTFKKTAFFREGNNINEMLFLCGGKNVSQNFKNNDTVSSINNNSLSTLSIIVKP